MARLFFTLLILSGWVLIPTAKAFVVQSGNPLSYQNVGRARETVSPSSASTPSQIAKAAQPVDDVVNYQAIARKLFPSRPEFLTVNLSKNTFADISIKRDYLVRVILPQVDNDSFWKIETNENVIKPLSTQHVENARSFEFVSVRRGNTKIYLDQFDSASRKVIQSRIIKVRVY